MGPVYAPCGSVFLSSPGVSGQVLTSLDHTRPESPGRATALGTASEPVAQELLLLSALRG